MRQLKITKSITNRDSNSLDKYLQEIGKEGLITPQKEAELARRIREGDQIALEKLVKANLRFVVSVAKQYQNQGLALADLINEGNLGLIKAAHRFDETRGFKFISYAVWWTRQSILQALAEQARMVRLPLNHVGNVNKLNRAHSSLEQKLEREPTHEELASFLDLKVQDVHLVSFSSGRHVSLDSPSDDGSTMIESVACPVSGPTHPSDNLVTESLKFEISRALKTLSPREAEVTKLHFGLEGTPLTLEEIGEKFDLTRERVRQIKEKAIRRLKHENRSKILKTYLS